MDMFSLLVRMFTRSRYSIFIYSWLGRLLRHVGDDVTQFAHVKCEHVAASHRTTLLHTMPTATASELVDIANRLDELFVEYLDLVGDYIEQWKTVEKTMNKVQPSDFEAHTTFARFCKSNKLPLVLNRAFWI